METLHYTAVLQLVNSYVAIEVDGNKKTFLNNASNEFKTAQVAAENFAHQKKIPYKSTLLLVTEDKPIITIVPYNGQWCPAEALSNGIRVLTHFQGQEENGLVGLKDWVTVMAKSIAAGSKADFIPQIGEALQFTSS